MNEADYYQNRHCWEGGRYLESADELRRFHACASLIPAGVATLLDVGTGNGAFLAHLAEHRSAIAATGLERSQIAAGSAVCAAALSVGSVERIPFPREGFDLVCALEVLEHLPCSVYQPALAELQRVARDYLLVSVPYRESRFLVRCPHCGCRFNPYFHMRSYCERSLTALFQQFQPEAWARVAVRDYPFSTGLRWFRATVLGTRPKAFHPFAMCPQCGFRDTGRDARKSAATQECTLTAGHPEPAVRLRELLSIKRRTKWCIVLYRRR